MNTTVAQSPPDIANRLDADSGIPPGDVSVESIPTFDDIKAGVLRTTCSCGHQFTADRVEALDYGAIVCPTCYADHVVSGHPREFEGEEDGA